jgi:protease I
MPSMCPGAPGIPISCALTQPCCLSFKHFRRQANPWARCATARRFFQSAKLTKGRKAAGYWAMMEDLANAGATVLDQPVVVDGNVITSRFIYDIPQFVDAIVAQLI